MKIYKLELSNVLSFAKEILADLAEESMKFRLDPFQYPHTDKNSVD